MVKKASVLGPLCKRGWLSFYEIKAKSGDLRVTREVEKLSTLESRLPLYLVNPPTQMLLQAFEPPPFSKEA